MRRRGLVRRSASRDSGSKRIPGLHHWRTSGSRWRAPAIGRLDEAEREALRGERLRRSPQPTVGHAHALLVLAQVRVARSRLERATTRPRARAYGRSRGFPIRGGYRRSPPPSSRTSSRLERMRGNGHVVEQPSAAELAVLRCLAAGLSRREIGAATVHLAEHRQDPHPRAVPQAGRNIASGRGRTRRGARPARSHSITRVILRPHGRNRGHPQAS